MKTVVGRRSIMTGCAKWCRDGFKEDRLEFTGGILYYFDSYGIMKTGLADYSGKPIPFAWWRTKNETKTRCA